MNRYLNKLYNYLSSSRIVSIWNMDALELNSLSLFLSSLLPTSRISLWCKGIDLKIFKTIHKLSCAIKFQDLLYPWECVCVRACVYVFGVGVDGGGLISKLCSYFELGVLGIMHCWSTTHHHQVKHYGSELLQWQETNIHLIGKQQYSEVHRWHILYTNQMANNAKP